MNMNEFDQISTLDNKESEVSETTDKTKAKEFDIADFIVKHYDSKYTIRKKSKLPMIIAFSIAAIIILGLCALAAYSFRNKMSIKGSWVSDQGVNMEIIDDYITINGLSMKYVDEKDNILSIESNGEYFKVLYQVSFDKLTFVIIDGSDRQEINYTRVNN